jgi:hypothetical protein
VITKARYHGGLPPGWVIFVFAGREFVGAIVKAAIPWIEP